MDPILACLMQMGVGVASSAVYDCLKHLSRKSTDRKTVESNVQNILKIQGIQMRASTIIDALIKDGYLVINNSDLYAPDSITFGTIQGTAIAGDSTRLHTDRTSIDAGQGAFLKTTGNAQVRQNPDGSISFHVGENGGDSISINIRE